MTTATDTCYPRETLKEYLSGWADPEQSDLIEAHLSQCESCEHTVVMLENDPETLCELVRGGAVAQHLAGSGAENAAGGQPRDVGSQLPPGASESQAASPADEVAESEDVISYALAKAKGMPPGDRESIGGWQPPTSCIGPYELLEPLGHGGMGSVYLARHQQLGKQVAIKLLPLRPFRNDHYAARFQREIRAAGRLNHPAIVSATDAGEHQATHYLVMEYIEGLDLSRTVRLAGPLAIADACEIIRQTALGLSYAHADGIVHRDIKPSNIMLNRQGDVKILDFGLAQVGLWDEASAELTTVGQLMGTLDYMAPEQAERADAVDYRADLYSLGATLFRLLCGRAPLAASPDLSPLAKLRLLGSYDPPALDVLRTDAPAELVALSTQLLARDPRERPASAAHVAEQLAPLAEGANLSGLIEVALQRVAEVPKESPSIHPGLNAPIAASQEASGEEKTSNAAAATDGGRRRSGRHAGRWIAVAMLPLLILAGVLVTLELQKGQLVIEAPDADVQVRLLQDGEVYKQLKVTPGINTTRLYAGKYQVEIDAGSDSVAIDNERIEITRGGTTMARLRLEPNATYQPLVESAPATLTEGVPGELTYNGKPLDAWLEQLATDRSPTSLWETMEAIKALANEESKELITEALLETLPQLDHHLAIKPSTDSESDASIDAKAFPILEYCQPTARDYFELLASELEKANSSRWAHRILSNHSIPRSANTGTSRYWFAGHSYRYEDYVPLVDAIDVQVLRSEADEEFFDQGIKYLTLLLNYDDTPDQLEPYIVAKLRASDRLDLDYWLGGWPPNLRVTYPQRAWESAAFLSEVEARAAVVLSNKATGSDVESRFVARALIILNALNGGDYSRAGMTVPSLEPEVVRKLLATYSVSQDRALELTEVPYGFIKEIVKDKVTEERFPWNPIKELHAVSPRDAGQRPAHTQASILLELFRLADVLQIDSQILEAELKKIVENMKPLAFAGAVSLDLNGYRQPRRDVLLGWPDFQAVTQFNRDLDASIPDEQWLAQLAMSMAVALMTDEANAELKDSLTMDLKRRWILSKLEEWDIDGDGKMTFDEARVVGYDTETLQRIDSNNDELIDKDELFEHFESQSQ
jgi:serine/threonine protein kinase